MITEELKAQIEKEAMDFATLDDTCYSENLLLGYIAGATKYSTELAELRQFKDERLNPEKYMTASEVNAINRMVDNVTNSVKKDEAHVKSLELENSQLKARISELEGLGNMLLHHVPNTPDFDSVRDKAKAALNTKTK